MFVIKRDGRHESVHLNKITARIAKLCQGLNMNFIDPAGVAVKVVKGMYAGVTTRELDQLAAETCKFLSF
jgi:ribonucleoside-diphosphate reductase subunit M1